MSNQPSTVSSPSVRPAATAYAAESATKELSSDASHAIRWCIRCGVDDCAPLFTFTEDFLVRTRGARVEDLRAIGWHTDTTSTIVRCRRCECAYIRDVFIADEDKFAADFSEEDIRKKVEKYGQQFGFQNVNHLRYCRRVIDVLLRHLWQGKRHARAVSFLDFGSCISILTQQARASGFDRVVSYDPKFRPNLVAALNEGSRRHPLNVEYERHRDALRTQGPFDAIVCQSAIEHFYNPQAELQLMRDVLADDGILFINSPIMPLHRELPLLQREGEITDHAVVKNLQKSYHIDHLNYILPHQFARMLHQAGLRERTVYFSYPYFSTSVLERARWQAKATAHYLLECGGSTFKRVNFFCGK